MARIRDFWLKASSFPQETTEFRSHPAYSVALEQLRSLPAVPDLIVELGSGSGAYLAFVRESLNAVVIGSDIPSPRLSAAVAAFPDITFEPFDALAMIRRHKDGRVAFLAMHVFGSLDLEELKAVLSSIPQASTLTFSAVGIPSGAAMLSTPLQDGTFNHNYRRLVSLCGLSVLGWAETALRSDPSRSRYVGTVTAPA